MNIRRSVAILIASAISAAGLYAQVPASAVSVSGFSSRGIPLQGQVLFGAASGNSTQDPLPREATVGGKFGIHRTYWRGDQQSSAVARAKEDLANGRLPWVSFKTPYASGTSTPLSWDQMVAGAGDAWAKDLAAKLGALSGPVWVAVHHEPENDSGDLQTWKRMQQRLSPIFRAYPNIAYTVILMGYHQFGAPTIDPKMSMEALYPGSQYVDLVGFDPYMYYGTYTPGPELNTKWSELRAYYTKIASWASSAGGAKWAIAETGYSDLAAERDIAWLSRAYDDMKTLGGVAFTYWDNQFKEGNTWRLNSEIKQAEFARVLARSDRLSGSPVAVPAAPTGLVASASGTSAVNLTWSVVTGATSYAVLRDGVQVGSTQTTSYTDSGLTAGTSYVYSVQASNAGGTSPTSNPTTVTTPVTAPLAPSGLVGSASGNTAVSLSWSASSGAASYAVLRDGVQVGSTQTTSYTDSGLTAGTSYAYSVQASNAGGTSPTSNPTTVTTPVTAPLAPSGLVGSASGNTAVSLSWSASSGATSYAVLRDGVQVGSTQTTSYTDSGLTAGTSYVYSVQASNAGGTSPTSNPTTVTTPVTAPVGEVTFRAGNTVTGNAAKAAVTIPAQVQGGDTLILFVSTNTGVAPSETTAGWVNAGERSVKGLRTVMWTRVAGGADAGSLVTVTLPKTSKYDLTMLAYSGASSARPISALASAPEVTSTTMHLTPSVTVPNSTSVVLSYWVDKSSATTGWMLPANQVRRSLNLGAGNGRLTSVAADSGRTAAGGNWAPVTATASASSAKATMWTVALTVG